MCRGVELNCELGGVEGAVQTNKQLFGQAGAHFSIHCFLLKLNLPSFLGPPTFLRASVSSIPPLAPHQLPDNTNMNLTMTRTSSVTINRMMIHVPLSIFLAIGAGFFQNLVAVEASNTKTVNDFVDNNFAFGRPISPARRKRLPGSQLKGGRGLLTIEELEEEFEAVRLVHVAHTSTCSQVTNLYVLCFGSHSHQVNHFISISDISFGNLFFDRVLHESSMSYSMSYGFG